MAVALSLGGMAACADDQIFPLDATGAAKLEGILRQALVDDPDDAEASLWARAEAASVSVTHQEASFAASVEGFRLAAGPISLTLPSARFVITPNKEGSFGIAAHVAQSTGTADSNGSALVLDLGSSDKRAIRFRLAVDTAHLDGVWSPAIGGFGSIDIVLTGLVLHLPENETKTDGQTSRKRAAAPYRLIIDRLRLYGGLQPTGAHIAPDRWSGPFTLSMGPVSAYRGDRDVGGLDLLVLLANAALMPSPRVSPDGPIASHTKLTTDTVISGLAWHVPVDPDNPDESAPHSRIGMPSIWVNTRVEAGKTDDAPLTGGLSFGWQGLSMRPSTEPGLADLLIQDFDLQASADGVPRELRDVLAAWFSAPASADPAMLGRRLLASLGAAVSKLTLSRVYAKTRTFAIDGGLTLRLDPKTALWAIGEGEISATGLDDALGAVAAREGFIADLTAPAFVFLKGLGAPEIEDGKVRYVYRLAASDSGGFVVNDLKIDPPDWMHRR